MITIPLVVIVSEGVKGNKESRRGRKGSKREVVR